MSLHMIFTIIQLLPLRSPNLPPPEEANVDEGGWTYWLYLVSSKGIYSVLVSLILVCCVLNALKSKFGVKSVDVDVDLNLSKWIDNFWKNCGGNQLTACGPLKAYRLPGLGVRTYDFEDELNEGQCLYEKVVIAETELDALRNAVDITHRASSYLEESLEEIEKDKDDTEGRSIVEKQWMYSEIENFKADMELLQGQLANLKKEKDEVLERCACLQEEALKASEALKKRQEVQEKLDEALTVVSVLRQAVADLEADREEAMASISGQYDLRNSTCQEVEKIGGIVFTNVRGNQGSSVNRSVCEEDLTLLGRGDDLPTADDSTIEDDQWLSYEDQGYGEVIVSPYSAESQSNDRTLNEAGDFIEENVEEEEDEEMRTDQEFDEDQIELSRSVQLTKSVAFKQFLHNNFGQF